MLLRPRAQVREIYPDVRFTRRASLPDSSLPADRASASPLERLREKPRPRLVVPAVVVALTILAERRMPTPRIVESFDLTMAFILPMDLEVMPPDRLKQLHQARD